MSVVALGHAIGRLHSRAVGGGRREGRCDARPHTRFGSGHHTISAAGAPFDVCCIRPAGPRRRYRTCSARQRLPGSRTHCFGRVCMSRLTGPPPPLTSAAAVARRGRRGGSTCHTSTNATLSRAAQQFQVPLRSLRSKRARATGWAGQRGGRLPHIVRIGRPIQPRHFPTCILSCARAAPMCMCRRRRASRRQVAALAAVASATAATAAA